MSAASVAIKHDLVDEFLQELEAAGDDDERKEFVLRDIQGLVRYAKRFYRDFLEEIFSVRVRSFTFRDKRMLARRMVAVEAGSSAGKPNPQEPETILAEYYEDLVDMLHGDIDFGYSDDIADFTEFHRDLYPNWLIAVGEWLDSTGDTDAKDELWNLADRFRDVVAY